MEPGATRADVDALLDRTGLSDTAHVAPFPGRWTIVAPSRSASEEVTNAGHVERVVDVSGKHNLVSRQFQPADTVVEVGGHKIDGDTFTVIAGPCAIEDAGQLATIAEAVHQSGASILRGGAFKPRTSPYSFQGLEKDGLSLLAEQRAALGMPVVTEVMDVTQVDQVCEHADMLQIGTRNMQNYALLREVGRSGRPVLLKRGMASTVDEWLLAAEYVMVQGNPNVVLCERGVRTFETTTRFTLDLAAVAAAKLATHLPVIVDPSHATGRVDLVRPMTLAAAAAGADGVILDVHHDPASARCDGAQALLPGQFDALMDQVREIRNFLG